MQVSVPALRLLSARIKQHKYSSLLEQLPVRRVAAVVTAILLCGSVALLLLSRSYPLYVTNGLMQCDGIPCFRTIIPEQTFMREAQAILDDGATSSGMKVSLFPSPDGVTVGAIFIETAYDDPDATLAAILDIYGTPSCVEIYAQANRLTLHYPLIHTAAHFHGNQLSAGTQLRSIVLGNPNPSADQTSPCNRVLPSDQSIAIRPWLGFATIERYLDN